MAFDIICAAILIGELWAFYSFYSRSLGARAVYFSWFAWLIDAGAIISGSVIMYIAFFIHDNPAAFNFHVSFAFVLFVYLIGSWQASIHAVKMFLRTFKYEQVRRMHSQAFRR